MSSEWLLHSSTEHIKQTLVPEPAPSQAAPRYVSSEQGRGQVYLFNWDGSPAPDAVRTALQAFLLFVWVAPFPRLQAKVKLAFGQG